MQDLEESSIPDHPIDETIARRRLIFQPQNGRTIYQDIIAAAAG